MKLNGVLVKDLKGDTLLSSGQVRVNITDWFFFKDKIELKYIGLTDTYIRLFRNGFGLELSVSGRLFWFVRYAEKKTIQLHIRDIDISESSPDQRGCLEG